MCHEERFELNIACPLHLKMKAQEHKCVNDYCDAEQQSDWMAALPPSFLPFWAVLLPLACTPWVTLMSFPTLAKQNSADPWLFLFWDLWIWDLVALYTSEYRSSSFTLVLPPYNLVCLHKWCLSHQSHLKGNIFLKFFLFPCLLLINAFH